MSEENKSTETQQPPAAPLPDDVMEGLRSLVKGDADGDKDHALRLLYNDNKQLRDANRELKQNQPAEDAEVLEGDEAERYRSVEAGEGSTALETLQSQAEGKQEAETELAQVKREQSLRDFADATGASYDALKAHANGEAYEVREETDDDGNEVKRGYVTPEATEDNPNPETVAIGDYDRFEHVNLFPAQEETETKERPTVPNQRPGGNAPDSGNSLVNRYLEQNYPSNNNDD